jgi:hypothetical protein
MSATARENDNYNGDDFKKHAWLLKDDLLLSKNILSRCIGVGDIESPCSTAHILAIQESQMVLTDVRALLSPREMTMEEDYCGSSSTILTKQVCIDMHSSSLS